MDWQKISSVLCPWLGQAVNVLLVVDALLEKGHIVGIDSSDYVPRIAFVTSAVVGLVRGTKLLNFELDNLRVWVPLAKLEHSWLLRGRSGGGALGLRNLLLLNLDNLLTAIGQNFTLPDWRWLYDISL